MHDKELILQNVWRVCNKIRAALFRVKGLKLRDHFIHFDPKSNKLISESQFVSVFTGPLKQPIGLSYQEIADLTDYFRVQDGRIFYAQLCDVIENVPTFEKNKQLVTGLEWEDPMHTNRLGVTEERRLSLLITKIATSVNMRRLVLRPYFQDYELIAKNNGTVTINHFARILDYLKILVSADDFHLLVKKYIKDSYTINYIAFLDSIDKVIRCFESKGMLDLGGNIHELFPGRVISAELPKLPRPEIGTVHPTKAFGKQSIFHPILATKAEQESFIMVIRRIQRHVYTNSIRIKDFFTDFDPLRSGRCSLSQFRRGLDSVGISGIDRLYLSEPEIDALTVQYRDPVDPLRVFWETFVEDIDLVFTTKELEKYPDLRVDTPPLNVKLLPKKGSRDWQCMNPDIREMCEEIIDKIKRRCTFRQCLLKPVFRDYDKHNCGHVSRAQMRQCMRSNGILLSDEELYALEQRFNDDVGFNYQWFLKEAEPMSHVEPLFKDYMRTMRKVNAPRPKPPPKVKETDIVMILAKIKGKVVRERIRVMEFLRQYDKTNKNCITKENFTRALSVSCLDLSEKEIETLVDVFASPMRPKYVDYLRFSDVIEEAFSQKDLQRAPLIVPLQHLSITDCEKNFLNYDERCVVSMALEKLATKPDMMINLLPIFKDQDQQNCGTISRGHFVKALTLRGLMNLISSHEFDVVCKCFGYERGFRDEVDYRAFSKALDILFINSRQKPF